MIEIFKEFTFEAAHQLGQNVAPGAYRSGSAVGNASVCQPGNAPGRTHALCHEPTSVRGFCAGGCSRFLSSRNRNGSIYLGSFVGWETPNKSCMSQDIGKPREMGSMDDSQDKRTRRDRAHHHAEPGPGQGVLQSGERGL